MKYTKNQTQKLLKQYTSPTFRIVNIGGPCFCNNVNDEIVVLSTASGGEADVTEAAEQRSSSIWDDDEVFHSSDSPFN